MVAWGWVLWIRSGLVLMGLRNRFGWCLAAGLYFPFYGHGHGDYPPVLSVQTSFFEPHGCIHQDSLPSAVGWAHVLGREELGGFPSVVARVPVPFSVQTMCVGYSAAGTSRYPGSASW